MKREFRFDSQYEQHERGEIGACAYFDHLASTLQLTGTRADVERGWNSIFVGEIETTRKLVESVRQWVPCFAFSNTNASHMATWSQQFPAVAGAFDRVFTSHEIGLRKPEREAFEHICRNTGYAAESFLFFDDLPENVHAASAAGLHAVLVRSPQDIVDALAVYGWIHP